MPAAWIIGTSTPHADKVRRPNPGTLLHAFLPDVSLQKTNYLLSRFVQPQMAASACPTNASCASIGHAEAPDPVNTPAVLLFAAGNKSHDVPPLVASEDAISVPRSAVTTVTSDLHEVYTTWVLPQKLSKRV